MFIGEYLTQIGDKNRVAIPKKLRDQMEGRIILTRGYERCLLMVDYKRWESLVNQLNTKPLLSLGVRDTKRFILGGATELEYDSQGRFVLPESLKIYANLQDKIAFLGVGEWIEIWSESKWLEKLENLSENVADIADRLNV